MECLKNITISQNIDERAMGGEIDDPCLYLCINLYFLIIGERLTRESENGGKTWE